MYWIFLKEVFKRAFHPAPRVTDGLQILAASALPALAKFFGVRFSHSVNNDALAYIGAVAVLFIVIRLFWAPYSLWKTTVEENSAMKLELKKPERMVSERLARQKAKALVKVVEGLNVLQFESFSTAATKKTRINKELIKVVNNATISGLPFEYRQFIMRFGKFCREYNPNVKQDHNPVHITTWMAQYAYGDINLETLTNSLPNHFSEQEN